MVSYKHLIKGKKYKLGGIKVGKFVRLDREPDGDIVLIFTGSQYGETGENTIYPDEQDDFEEIERNAGGSAKNKRSNKNKTTKTRTKKTQKQKSKRFSNKHKNFRK
jgi:hypothetical protein